MEQLFALSLTPEELIVVGHALTRMRRYGRYRIAPLAAAEHSVSEKLERLVRSAAEAAAANHPQFVSLVEGLSD